MRAAAGCSNRSVLYISEHDARILPFSGWGERPLGRVVPLQHRRRAGRRSRLVARFHILGAYWYGSC